MLILPWLSPLSSSWYESTPASLAGCRGARRAAGCSARALPTPCPWFCGAGGRWLLVVPVTANSKGAACAQSGVNPWGERVFFALGGLGRVEDEQTAGRAGQSAGVAAVPARTDGAPERSAWWVPIARLAPADSSRLSAPDSPASRQGTGRAGSASPVPSQPIAQQQQQAELCLGVPHRFWGCQRRGFSGASSRDLGEGGCCTIRVMLTSPNRFQNVLDSLPWHLGLTQAHCWFDVESLCVVGM